MFLILIRNIDGGFKELYQLNSPKGYKTFGDKISFSPFCIKNQKFVFLPSFSTFSI